MLKFFKKKSEDKREAENPDSEIKEAQDKADTDSGESEKNAGGSSEDTGGGKKFSLSKIKLSLSKISLNLSKKKIIIIAASTLVLTLAGGAVWFFVLPGKGESGPDEAPAAEAAEKSAGKQAPVVYDAAFEMGQTKLIQDADDKEASPVYEITVISAKELTAEDKESHGLSREKGRIAAIGLNIRLIDTSSIWDMYRRRIVYVDGLPLDEIKAEIDEQSLYAGHEVTGTIFVRLPDAKAEGGDKVSLLLYTASWNNKAKNDGVCDGIKIEPPPRQTPARPSRPARQPVIVETVYGNWTDKVYTSDQLGITLELPENWNNRASAVAPGTSRKSMEASATRTDGKAVLQISVDKQAGDTTEASYIKLITDLLNKSSEKPEIGDPYRKTIAGKDFYCLTYSNDTSFYMVHTLKIDGKMLEITVNFPLGEHNEAESFMNIIKAVN